MDLDADMIPTSPSADSSPSSSDLDTEVTLHPRVFLDCLADTYGLTCWLWMTSRFLMCVCWGRQSTGSFFPDRSTTLGTLMGVSAFGGRRAAAAGEGSAEGPQRAALGHGEEARGAGVWRRRRRRRRRRGSWWRLCRDHGAPPTSLGEFLDMERQLAGADFLCDGSGAGASGRETAALFENGRVRPPPQQPAAEERGRWRLLRASDGSSTSTATASASLARLPVLLTGICSGGAG